MRVENQADEMLRQFRRDCRMAAIKQAVKCTSLFAAAIALLTWLTMRW